MPQRILLGDVKYDGVLYEKGTTVDFPQEILDGLPEGTCKDVPPPPKVVRAPRAKVTPPAAPATPPPAPPTPTTTASTPAAEEKKEPEAGATPEPPAPATSEEPASAEEPAAPVTTG